MKARKEIAFPRGHQPSILVMRYCAQYGASHRTVHRLGAARLAQMAPHARATLFSSLRWHDQRRKYTLANFGLEIAAPQNYFVQKPKGVVSQKKVDEMVKLMKSVEKASA